MTTNVIKIKTSKTNRESESAYNNELITKDPVRDREAYPKL